MAFVARALCVPYIGNYNEAMRLLDGKREKYFSAIKTYRIHQHAFGIELTYHNNCVVDFHPDGTKTIKTCGYETPSTRNVINTQLRRSQTSAHKGRTVFADPLGKRYYLYEITIDAEERYLFGANPVIVIQEDLQIKREVRRELKTFYYALDVVTKLNNTGEHWNFPSNSVSYMGARLAEIYHTGGHRDLAECLKILTEEFAGRDVSEHRDELRDRIIYELAVRVKPFQIEITLPLGEI